MPAAAEIDGNPVGAGRPVSTIAGRAELASGNGFRPGHTTPHTPDAVGIGGGTVDVDRNTWDNVPPQYSPGRNPEPYSYPDRSELADTSVAPVLDEKEDQLPAATEMPTVRTPPAHEEMQMHR